MTLKVLISGGGIAGPSLAFWLARLGYRCTITERFHELRTGGQQIDLKAQGIDVVKRMGLLEEVRKHGVDEVGLQFVDSRGKRKAFFPKEENNGGQGFTSEFEIMRGDMCRILYQATSQSCDYRFGVFVESFEDEGQQVKVKFSDGTESTYDLLVGADGQESRIRKSILGQEADKASRFPLGVMGCYYQLERDEPGEKIATVYHAPQRRVMSTRWHSDHQGQAYLFTMAHTDELKKCLREGIEDQKETFIKIFGTSGWQAEQLVDALRKSTDFYAQEVVQIRSPFWSKGRVVLLGDAGYAPTPLTGMGTSLAVIGAYVLAGEISRHEQDITEGLKSYEKTMRPLVEDIQNLPKGVPDLAYPESTWGIKLMYGLLGFASAIKLNKAVALLISKDSKDRWQLPPMPENAFSKAGGLDKSHQSI